VNPQSNKEGKNLLVASAPGLGIDVGLQVFRQYLDMGRLCQIAVHLSGAAGLVALTAVFERGQRDADRPERVSHCGGAPIQGHMSAGRSGGCTLLCGLMRNACPIVFEN